MQDGGSRTNLQVTCAGKAPSTPVFVRGNMISECSWWGPLRGFFFFTKGFIADTALGR